MCEVYMFDTSVSKYSGNRVVLYPPREYQEKLRRHHGRKVKLSGDGERVTYLQLPTNIHR